MTSEDRQPTDMGGGRSHGDGRDGRADRAGPPHGDHRTGGDGRTDAAAPSSSPSPTRRLGDRPGVLLGAGLAALVLFTGLATAVAVASGRPLPLDESSHLWGARHRTPDAVAVARALTDTGTGVWPYALVALAGLLIGRSTRGRLGAAVCCLALLGAGQGVRTGVLALVSRPRPPLGDWATHASSWSFPSGHTATSAITAGVLITAVLLRSPPGQGIVVAVIGLWAVGVGVTRVYLGVHWLTDVVGGWFFALAWLCLSGAALRWSAWRRAAEPSAVAGGVEVRHVR